MTLLQVGRTAMDRVGVEFNVDKVEAGPVASGPIQRLCQLIEFVDDNNRARPF